VSSGHLKGFPDRDVSQYGVRRIHYFENFVFIILQTKQPRKVMPDFTLILPKKLQEKTISIKLDYEF